MSSSTMLMNAADTSGAVGPVQQAVWVEFRAATPDEIREIDMSAPDVVLPAHVFMDHRQWREAMAPFAARRSDHYRSPHVPGAMIWAQLGSRAGDMVVGGRDRLGMPSVPVPAANGDIYFASAIPDSADETDWTSTSVEGPSLSVALLERLSVDLHRCHPILSAEGPISCPGSDCDECLQVLTRNSWNTSIACVCP
ncbi:MAG TPA: hypothetical protein VF115_16400 [Acidimicrobiia bacterium]